MRALSTAASGMMAQQLNVDVISHNIANINTTGFKRERVEFADMMYQNLVRPGSTSSETGTIVPSGISVGTGAKPVGIYRINEQGGTQSTGNKLDIAITGDGYFQVELPNGDTAYTRAGSLQMNADGVLVTPQGYTVTPAMTIPNNASDITINGAGQVFAKVDGQTDPQNVGQMQLARFANPAGLEAIGDNLLLETPASGTAAVGNPASVGYGKLMQGYVENSNVDIVKSITDLITAQRAYEMNSKVIRTADDMLSATNQIK